MAKAVREPSLEDIEALRSKPRRTALTTDDVDVDVAGIMALRSAPASAVALDTKPKAVEPKRRASQFSESGKKFDEDWEVPLPKGMSWEEANKLAISEHLSALHILASEEREQDEKFKRRFRDAWAAQREEHQAERDSALKRGKKGRITARDAILKQLKAGPTEEYKKEVFPKLSPADQADADKYRDRFWDWHWRTYKKPELQASLEGDWRHWSNTLEAYTDANPDMRDAPNPFRKQHGYPAPGEAISQLLEEDYGFELPGWLEHGLDMGSIEAIPALALGRVPRSTEFELSGIEKVLSGVVGLVTPLSLATFGAGSVPGKALARRAIVQRFIVGNVKKQLTAQTFTRRALASMYSQGIEKALELSTALGFHTGVHDMATQIGWQNKVDLLKWLNSIGRSSALGLGAGFAGGYGSGLFKKSLIAGGSGLSAEVAAFATANAFFEGRMPNWDDFLECAGVLAGAKVALVGTRVFTGKVAQVTGDMMKTGEQAQRAVVHAAEHLAAYRKMRPWDIEESAGKPPFDIYRDLRVSMFEGAISSIDAQLNALKALNKKGKAPADYDKQVKKLEKLRGERAEEMESWKNYEENPYRHMTQEYVESYANYGASLAKMELHRRRTGVESLVPVQNELLRWYHGEPTLPTKGNVLHPQDGIEHEITMSSVDPRFESDMRFIEQHPGRGDVNKMTPWIFGPEFSASGHEGAKWWTAKFVEAGMASRYETEKDYDLIDKLETFARKFKLTTENWREWLENYYGDLDMVRVARVLEKRGVGFADAKNEVRRVAGRSGAMSITLKPEHKTLTRDEVRMKNLEAVKGFRYRLKDIRNLADPKPGTMVKLYHGAPRQFAEMLVKAVKKGEQSGPSEAMEIATSIAKKYGIPLTEFLNKTPARSLVEGYEGDKVSRLSTAPASIATRWADTFPLGEIGSSLEGMARLYQAAKKKGVSYDDFVEAADVPISGDTWQIADQLGLKSKFVDYGKGGALVEITVPAEAVPEGVKSRAKQHLRHPERAEWTFNKDYIDIKIHKSNIRSAKIVADIEQYSPGKNIETKMPEGGMGDLVNKVFPEFNQRQLTRLAGGDYGPFKEGSIFENLNKFHVADKVAEWFSLKRAQVIEYKKRMYRLGLSARHLDIFERVHDEVRRIEDMADTKGIKITRKVTEEGADVEVPGEKPTKPSKPDEYVIDLDPIIDKYLADPKYQGISKQDIIEMLEEYKVIDDWGKEAYIPRFEFGSFRAEIIIDACKDIRQTIAVAPTRTALIERVLNWREAKGSDVKEIYIRKGPTFSGQEAMEMVSRGKYWAINASTGEQIASRLTEGIEEYRTEQYKDITFKISGEAKPSDIKAMAKAISSLAVREGMKGNIGIKPPYKAAGPLMKSKDVLLGEENLIKAMRYYALQVNRKLALDPMILEFRKHGDRDLKDAPVLKEMIENQIRVEKGGYSFGDQVVDGWIAKLDNYLLEKSKGRYDTSSLKWPKIRAGMYSNFVADVRKGVAWLKLGYRPIAGFVNGVSGLSHLHAKVGFKYMSEAFTWLRTPEGRSYIGTEGSKTGYLTGEPESKYMGVSIALEEGEIRAPHRIHPWQALWAFQYPEKHVRKLTLAANFLYARKELGLADGAAALHARRAVRFQQFVYNAAALPYLLQGPTGKLLGQFKSYLVNEIQFLTSLRGREIARYATVQIAFGGTKGMMYMLYGLPLFGWVFQDLGIEHEMNKHVPGFHRGIATWLPRGINALTGANLPQVDLSMQFTPTVPHSKSDWETFLAGPALSDFFNFGKFIKETVIDGIPDWKARGWDDLSSMFVAGRYFQEAVSMKLDRDGALTNMKGQVVWKPNNTVDILLHGIGAKSAELTLAQDSLREHARVERIQIKKIGAAADRFIRHYQNFLNRHNIRDWDELKGLWSRFSEATRGFLIESVDAVSGAFPKGMDRLVEDMQEIVDYGGDIDSVMDKLLKARLEPARRALMESTIREFPDLLENWRNLERFRNPSRD